MFTSAIAIAAAAGVGIPIMASISLRRVVGTNMAHIVQRRRKATTYGTTGTSGNVYWAWPSWVPMLGITVIKLPVSNFAHTLINYDAYDKDRVPFVVDVTAFFRIADTARAAQRVVNMDELVKQLDQIVKGAVRKVLASDVIDSIMLERAKFGEAFTAEVAEQLMEWGVESVKSMELMDIRDADGQKSIHNIMSKKTSHIEMEGRTAVAQNRQQSELAEITADQTILVRRQESDQMVGLRTAERTKTVGIAEQQSRQEVLAAERETEEAQMQVRRVTEVRQAEITRDKTVVAAEQGKQTRILEAEGNLEAQKREAEGVKVLGEANATAKELMLLAPVKAQIELAEKIGGNEGYLTYLVAVKTLETYQDVGAKQAEALGKAEIKIIANSGDVMGGVNGVTQMLNSSGGLNLGAMLTGFASTPEGEKLLGAIKSRLTGDADIDGGASGAAAPAPAEAPRPRRQRTET